MSRRMCPHGFNLNDGPCEDCDPVAALREAKEHIEKLETKMRKMMLKVAERVRFTLWEQDEILGAWQLPGIVDEVLRDDESDESEAWLELMEHAKKTEEE